MDIGAQLRTSREAQGISLALLAEKTRVQPRILAAIELNDIRAIPPKPFGRGFVRAYAHEVGLDPERTVHDYFGQFASVVPSKPVPAPVVHVDSFGRSRLLTAGGLGLVMLAGLFVFQSFRTVNTVASDDGVVGTAGNAGAAAAAVPASEPRAPEPVAPPTRLTISVSVDRACWITATADGERVIYQLMPAGSAQVLQATREVALRTGDAGAVRLIINGRDTGPLGQAGEVRNARITLENATTFGRAAQ